MKTEDVLRKAADTVEERRGSYGDTKKFFDSVAQHLNFLGYHLTPVEIIDVLRTIKAHRLTDNPNHLDSLIDLVAYTAMLGEWLDD